MGFVLGIVFVALAMLAFACMCLFGELTKNDFDK